MNAVRYSLLTPVAVAFTCYAAHYPPMTETVALANTDLLAQSKVLAIAPFVDHGVTQNWASVISIEILTKGVSAKGRATVLWNQRLADATLTPKGPPGVGRGYRVYLRLRVPESTWDFEPVHPDWGFVESKGTDSQTEPAFVEHTVQDGDTLWSLAAHYYGTGTRWRVLRVANFTNEAQFQVYPLRKGMRLRIPAFPMKKSPQDGAANGSQPIRSETNST